MSTGNVNGSLRQSQASTPRDIDQLEILSVKKSRKVIIIIIKWHFFHLHLSFLSSLFQEFR